MNDKLWASALLLAFSSNAVLLAILLFSHPNSPSAHNVQSPESLPPVHFRQPVKSDKVESTKTAWDHQSDLGWLHLDARVPISRIDLERDSLEFGSNKVPENGDKFFVKQTRDVDHMSVNDFNRLKRKGRGGSDSGEPTSTATSDDLKKQLFSTEDLPHFKDLLMKLFLGISNHILSRHKEDPTDIDRVKTTPDEGQLEEILFQIFHERENENIFETTGRKFSKFSQTEDLVRNSLNWDSYSKRGKRTKREVATASTTATGATAKYKSSSKYETEGPPWGKGTPTKINYIHATPEKYGMEPVFSAFTKKRVDRMSRSIAEVMLPALVHFEAIVFRHLDGLHSALVNQELRLGHMEKMMNSLEDRVTSRLELQSDAEDNKTEMKEINDIIGEGFQLYRNESGIVEVIGEGDGSGSIDEWTLPTVTTPTTTTTTTPEPTTTPPPTTTTTTTTTTTLPPTTTPNILLEQMKENVKNISYKLFTLDQKIEDLRNYRAHNDEALMMARTEVIRMDDKVAELERKHRNMKVRSTMQNYKLTELDMYMGRSELTMQTTMDTFQRMMDRFDSFKDKMSDFKDDVHKMSSAFRTQTQVSEELRTADAHKAHDIQDLRKSIMTIQSQFNDLYRVVDEGVMSMRNEIMASVERVCHLNELIC